ncbi:hypothetical protein GGX14DRAFT_610573 [Mycena pura]|uniref:Stealth protein CR3 conserved region 3 domain-containing protein n=1 Tax=Mycena pura TaxID=153505 RepID=A0AAD6UN44_9AGAR|nr:hypothetical protein GGX14DRAFT_610573 [Mycena pura]
MQIIWALRRMASRSLYLYQPLGHSHEPPSWRDKLCTPARGIAILLIVALSLMSVAFVTMQHEWPWAARLIPHGPASAHPAWPPRPPAYEGAAAQAALVGPATYHPFVAPTAAQARADPRVRPVRAHAALSDACVDRWVSTGSWGDPCARAMVSEARIDLVYIWVNGSCVRAPFLSGWFGLTLRRDALHQQARKTLLAEMGYRTKDARFREHDELRFSLRAARNATAAWPPGSTWHIVTADVPDPELHRAPGSRVVEYTSALARRDVDSVATDEELSSETEAEKSEASVDADMDAEPEPEGQHRLGLVPQWLDIECASQEPEEGHGAQPPIRLQHDAQLFRLTGPPNATQSPTPDDAAAWLERILPSFNSHAVESQLAHLDPAAVSDSIVALNDDQFMLLPLPPAAFHTALYGPVFRMDPNLLVAGDPSGKADGGGEWRSLGWSAHLLSAPPLSLSLPHRGRLTRAADQRFGTRKRPYMQHNARALALPLLHEAALAFGAQFAATPLSRFRGAHAAPGELEVNTIFLATHFVVERHREALLWAWVVGKWGGAGGGALALGAAAKRGMWADLGGGSGEELRLARAERSTAEDVELNLLMAGVRPPQAVDKQREGDTTYSWVSMDGYSASFKRLAEDTVIKRGECIGRDSERAWDMFRRLLKDDISCGDNVISALIHKQRSGLGAFLPAPLSHPAAVPADADAPLTLPLALPADPPPLPADPRAFAVRLLQRYAHVLGDSPTIFGGMRSVRGTERLLRDTDGKRDTALLCLNDDLGNTEKALRDTERVLRAWFERKWPEKLSYDGQEEEEEEAKEGVQSGTVCEVDARKPWVAWWPG